MRAGFPVVEPTATTGDWQAAHAEASARWPGVRLDTEALTTHATRVGADPASKHAADLFLACAVLRGDRTAVAVFEGELVAGASGSIARVHRDADFVDEVCQELRKKLLVGPPPRLDRYIGLSPLAAWIRVTAVRLAYDIGRAGLFRAHEHDEGRLEEIADAALGPELVTLKKTLGPTFQQALRAALAALSARERNVLRLNLVEGLSIDEIAAPYRVHRATAARWLNDVRVKLADEVRGRVLAEHPALRTAELESLAALVVSQLHLSLT